jgi:superfamily I DNA/RNA helicase
VTSLLDAAIGELTDEQRLAVQHSGDFSLLARPGSGKTRVVGLRLALAAAEQSKSIAVTSYTNVAVEEVHTVVAKAGVVPGPEHYVGTLHRLLLDYIVRPHGHLVREGKGGTLRIRHDDWVTGGGWPVVTLGDNRNRRVPISYFDWTANEQVVCRRRPPGFKYATVEQITELGAEEARKLKDLQMKQRGIITQSDAMFVALKVLSRSRLATALAGRFDELIVDEAQDTSDVQLACIETLRATGALRSLVIVADLEQSIYGFQGADPGRCERLITQGGIEPLDLTRNFRSSKLSASAMWHATSHLVRRPTSPWVLMPSARSTPRSCASRQMNQKQQ